MAKTIKGLMHKPALKYLPKSKFNHQFFAAKFKQKKKKNKKSWIKTKKRVHLKLGPESQITGTVNKNGLIQR